MPKAFWWVLALAAAALSPGLQQAAALEGRVVYADGEVAVLRGARELAAEVGMPVSAGDSVRTGADGTAIVELAGQGELKLRENTTVALDSLGERSSVSLSAGGLFARVVRRMTGRFLVRTQTAVAGVRGTEFFVAYGRKLDRNPDIWLCVNEGSVEVTVPDTGESVVVEEGKGINIVAGTRLTSPRPYAWTRSLNWNTDPASGTVVDRTDLDQAYSDLLDQDYN